MHFKQAFSILAAGGALLTACDSTVTNVNDEAKDKGAITIKVVDNHSGAALSDVTVFSVVDNKTVISDELGLSVWKGSVLGDHTYQISCDGYATVQATVTLEEQGKGDVSRVGDVITTIPMYKAGVIAKGIVLYNDEKGNLNAAKDVKVYADLPDQFVPSEVSVNTNENGEFTFDNLPEGTEVLIYVGQETIDSRKYNGPTATTIGGANFRSGDVINLSSISLVKATSQIVKISDNTTEIDSTSDVTFTFATELDADSVNNANWKVTNDLGDLVLTTASLNKDKRTISISPFSGKWTSDVSYTVRGSVYSADGSSSSISASFRVGQVASQEKPNNVKDLKIEVDPIDSDYLLLSWKAPKGDVDRYNIYRRTNKSPDFVQVSYTDTTYYSVDLYDFMDSEDEIYFVVLAVNEDGVESDIAEAKSVKYTIEE